MPLCSSVSTLRGGGGGALQADSLDSLGDAGVCALSLFVVGRVDKGGIRGLFGLAVLAEVGREALLGATRRAPIMVVAASIALGGQRAVLAAVRFRDQDINLRSVWLCSRNNMLEERGRGGEQQARRRVARAGLA